jgi:hypothetical protein
MSLRVFISSTSEDLKEFRAASRLAILDLQWHPEMMEHLPAQPGYTIDSCRKKLEECDLVLLIVAWRQGWVPSVEQGGNGRDSITKLEIDRADTEGIPVVTLLANDEWPQKFTETDDGKRQWVRSFRDNLNRVAQFFEYEKAESLPNFRTVVKQNLLAYKESLLRGNPPVQEAHRAVLDPRIIDRARTELADGTRTPVLGCGIHGRGPLSSPALVVGVLGDGKPDSAEREHISLATAAEYYERTLSRVDFLEAFADIVSRQAAQAAAPPILDLLARLGRVKTLISTTYDSLVEDGLGRPCTVISHVLRLHGEREDNGSTAGDQPEVGKVMLVRPGSAPEFFWADGFTLDPDECVVYKPHGSPVLSPIPNSILKADTAVVTETDHAIFLRHLGSRQTGVPASLMTRLRGKPLVFLGYTLDEWQYRLITLLFQSIGRQEKRTLAVRIPDSDVERAAWGGLNACLIEMDPNEFASSRGSAIAASPRR